MLVFNEGMQQILKEATKVDEIEDQLFQMMRVVQSVRTDIFNHPSFQFDGAFSLDCQSDLPNSLKTLVSLLLSGTDITDQDRVESQSCLTIAQLITFNVKTRNSKNSIQRISRKRETPLPLYIGLHVHTQSRSKKLVQQMHSLGLSVSYNRVMELENSLALGVSQRYMTDGMVCPASLRRGIYIVGELDRIHPRGHSMGLGLAYITNANNQT